ncbi:GlxA family transcriptional regulator [Denitromonas iodatirespirans]|uniref:GlxA family transcriptional regulator n=1 Tax=Denitromonas iodatirespirans TaxID=2795389 RepID=A0A944HBQ3_DENI1|nr:GlxA family transcriptional regulator [Denitromonas iodatirespirans]MBT0961912.1 GlxA family transcriptional regulator [Denitromonas iodatirespirans]
MLTDPSSVSRIGFLVLDEFTMIAFSSAIEVLRMANYASGRKHYEWTVFTVDGQPVTCSNGLPTAPMKTYADAGPLDMVFVCGGTNITRLVDDRVIGLLRRIAKDKVSLGGLCTGTYALVKSGLLDGYRATIHWENISGLRESHSRVNFVHELFVIDRDRITCTGGTAPIDLMLTLVGARCGKTLVAQICDQFSHERPRDSKDRQHIPLAARLGRNHEALGDVAALMEANIEEPLSLDELAHLAGLSQRHVQRMFREALGCTPSQYYLDLRLRRARELLLQTAMSITSITVACGFQSPCHFSKAYRALFGQSPSGERRYAGGMPLASRSRADDATVVAVAAYAADQVLASEVFAGAHPV